MPRPSFEITPIFFLTHGRKKGVIDLLHCDGAGDFLDSKVEAWAAALGTQRSFLVHQVHDTNASAERCWGVLLRSVRASVSHAGGDWLRSRFWPFLCS